jgi:hypothetical protein
LFLHQFGDKYGELGEVKIVDFRFNVGPHQSLSFSTAFFLRGFVEATSPLHSDGSTIPLGFD